MGGRPTLRIESLRVGSRQIECSLFGVKRIGRLRLNMTKNVACLNALARAVGVQEHDIVQIDALLVRDNVAYAEVIREAVSLHLFGEYLCRRTQIVDRLELLGEVPL